MCESVKNIPIIRVGEKTNKGKYDFLRSYYTLWNLITKTRPRVIVDTHAGTGVVELVGKKNILNERNNKTIYGSALLAILKTLKISNNLTIILNESNPKHYSNLKNYVDNFKQNGVPIFIKKKDEFYYKSLETKRKRKLKDKENWEFPESPDEKPSRGFSKIHILSKANIITHPKEIEEIIDEIFQKYLKPVEKRDRIIKPIALFLVDPCGSVGWKDVIEKICKRSNKEEGTELILNWSWEAINRNLTTEFKNEMLSRIYGTSIEKIEEEFKEINSMDAFLKKYIEQLEKYFKHVIHVGVPRDRKIRPKMSSHKKYFLLFCTNNESALSLGGSKTKNIKKAMRNYYLDLNDFTQPR